MRKGRQYSHQDGKENNTRKYNKVYKVVKI